MQIANSVLVLKSKRKSLQFIKVSSTSLLHAHARAAIIQFILNRRLHVKVPHSSSNVRELSHVVNSAKKCLQKIVKPAPSWH